MKVLMQSQLSNVELRHQQRITNDVTFNLQKFFNSEYKLKFQFIMSIAVRIKVSAHDAD